MKNAALLITALLLTCSYAFPQNKGLDESFGINGITDSVCTNKPFRFVSDMLLQPDGKILVAGDRFVVRYKTDGILDSSFGGSDLTWISGSSAYPDTILGGPGIFMPNALFTGTTTTASPISLLLQTDKKIIVYGTTEFTLSHGNFLLRLEPNGRPDSTFGTNGISLFYSPIGPVALQPDGKIIVAGIGYPHEYEIHRFLPNGTPDSSFGINGMVQTDAICYSSKLVKIGLLSDGRIVVIGTGCSSKTSNYHVAILRYLPDGSLDTTFGQKGIAHPFDAFYCYAGIIQQDGNMLVSVGGGIVRLRENGEIDSSFGQDGFAFGPSVGGIILQNDGKILGTTSGGDDAAVLRLKRDGSSIDSSFGVNGKITTDLTGSWEDAFNLLAIQPDGKIIAAGSGRIDTQHPFYSYLVRYKKDAAVGVPVTSLPENVPKVYPNPASDRVQIRYSPKSVPERIIIINAFGQTIFSSKAAQQMEVDVRDMPSGCYFIRWLYQNGVPVVLPLVVRH